MIGDYNGETNFPHKFIQTDRRVSKLHKVFANNSSANIKLTKAQQSKILQSGCFLGRLLRPLIKVDLPLMKNILKSLTKNLLIPLGLTAAASAADPRIHETILVSGCESLLASGPLDLTQEPQH